MSKENIEQLRREGHMAYADALERAEKAEARVRELEAERDWLVLQAQQAIHREEGAGARLAKMRAALRHTGVVCMVFHESAENRQFLVPGLGCPLCAALVEDSNE